MLCEEAFTGGSGRAGGRGFSLSEQGLAEVWQSELKAWDTPSHFAGSRRWLCTCPTHPLTRHLGWHSRLRCP